MKTNKTDAKPTHTKGPWTVEKGIHGYIVVLADEMTEDEDQMAVAVEPSRGHDEKANARLIAAAPDLLRIAKWAVTMLKAGGRPDQCYFDEADTIIAKSEANK